MDIFTSHISCITQETCNIKPMCRNTTVPRNPVLDGSLQVMKNQPHCLGESWWIAALTAQTNQASGWQYCHPSCCSYLGFPLFWEITKYQLREAAYSMWCTQQAATKAGYFRGEDIEENTHAFPFFQRGKFLQKFSNQSRFWNSPKWEEK